ncbi:MAG: JAB domain-containing protein [Gammaproteobacteria bacterium]|jgi:DNA repair protein RadC|nr:JAB domain-containing protein [Gammaproteobacteria bacterium]NBX40326.1 JAB domain-containing protein [Gammaproteobacteria bacterium]
MDGNRDTPINTWPEDDRPREKLLRRGAPALSDAELLALLLGTGTRGRNALELSRHLVGVFGDLRGLMCAPATRVLALPGLGPARVAVLQAALELARRHYHADLRERPLLGSPHETRRFLVAQLRDRPYEVFCCLYLDNRHHLIVCEELFRGTIDGAAVHPREVLRQALAHNAAAVILAHNHPSGIAEPSRADEIITRRLRDALALVDIRVLDHIIVAGPHTISLAERGIL